MAETEVEAIKLSPLTLLLTHHIDFIAPLAGDVVQLPLNPRQVCPSRLQSGLDFRNPPVLRQCTNDRKSRGKAAAARRTRSATACGCERSQIALDVFYIVAFVLRVVVEDFLSVIQLRNLTLEVLEIVVDPPA